MRDDQTAQLLEFIRHEVLPLLLAEAVPGGMEIMIARLKSQYPALDLFCQGIDSHSPRDVLLIEDRPELQHLLAVALTKRGYSVVVAKSPDEALARLRVEKPRAILVDHHLPTIDATQFRERQLAAEIEPEVPVVMYSSESGVRTDGLKFAAVVVTGLLLDGILSALEPLLLL